MSTHWDGCWRAHHDCAVLRVEFKAREVLQLRAIARDLQAIGRSLAATIDHETKVGIEAGARERLNQQLDNLTADDVQWRAGGLALDREWLAIRLREILDDEWCGTRYDAGVIADRLIKAMREE